MKVKPKFVVACDHALIDLQNQISAIGIFDRLILGSESVVLSFKIAGRFEVVEGSTAPSVATVEILDGSGNVIGDVLRLEDSEAHPEFPLNLAVAIHGLEITSTGTYSVRVKHGNQQLYEGAIFEVMPAPV